MSFRELREDGSLELREDGTIELREPQEVGGGGVGTSAGVATAPAVGASFFPSVGSAVGHTTVTGVARARAGATGTSIGRSTAKAYYGWFGTARGITTAPGIARALSSAVGTAAGIATANARWGAFSGSAGRVAGISTANGVGDGPFDLSFILPRNAQVFEKAIARAMMDRLPVPLREIVDPLTAPSEWLPFLAYHDSVDLWFSDWTDARKRTVISNAITDAALKGTRAGSIQFLSYVDGTLLDVLPFPSPFIVGRGIMGRTPLGLAPFLAMYLVKVVTYAPKMCFVMGRSAIGTVADITPDPTPLNRALIALRVAKAPETEIRVDFTTMRLLTLGDAPPLDGSYSLDEYLDRTKF
jgi:P2-related tail formation protein